MTQEELFFTIRRQLGVLGLFRLGQIVSGNKSSASILCYHGFRAGINRYAVSYKTFQEQVTALREFADIVPLDEVVAVVSGKRQRRFAVAITIDDGYESVMQLAEYIKKEHVPVTLFALSDPEHADRVTLGNSEKIVNYSDLRYLAKQGFTIGCHGATHVNITKLSETQLVDEVAGAKSVLEEKVGVPIKYFAYPNGYFTNATIEAVKKAGYKAGFSILPGTVTQNSNQWILPRTVVNSDDTIEKDPKLYLAGPSLIGSAVDRFGPWIR